MTVQANPTVRSRFLVTDEAEKERVAVIASSITRPDEADHAFAMWTTNVAVSGRSEVVWSTANRRPTEHGAMTIF